MKLSVKVCYACRVLAQMGRLHGTGQLAHIESLAETEQVPANYLVQILAILRDGGLILSRRGKLGGYALSRAPGEITLCHVVDAVEGDLLDLGEEFSGASGAEVRRVWSAARDAFRTVASRHTVEHMIARPPEAMWFI